MALLHHAELVPSKVELLKAWLPKQPWFGGSNGGGDADADVAVERVGAFRFDDPRGEVGIETLLVRAGDGPILQVPLTYRAAPLDEADDWLVGTMQHSVLGPRWVYDGTGDRAYLDELARVTLGGGRQVDQYYEENGTRTASPATAEVHGSGTRGFEVPSAFDDGVISPHTDGTSTLVQTEKLAFFIARVPIVHPLEADLDSDSLAGTWLGQTTPAILALVSIRS